LTTGDRQTEARARVTLTAVRRFNLVNNQSVYFCECDYVGLYEECLKVRSLDRFKKAFMWRKKHFVDERLPNRIEIVRYLS